ncbi:MAG TPA: hypothetical protein IGS31_07010, partial [Oscillatoriales cyanobacterium M4454_W2019_049]|nr:hypothetical protein [Oscillatoriales cyanobacterium M4454_W2019_049]
GAALAGGAAMAAGAGAAAWSTLSGKPTDETPEVSGEIEPLTTEPPTQSGGGFWQKASDMVQDAKESASNLVENATESGGTALAGGAAMAAGAGAAALSALSPKRQPPDETLTEEPHEATQAATFWVESASGTPIEPSGETPSSDSDSSTDTKPSV